MLRLDVGTLGFAAALTALGSAAILVAYGTDRHRDHRWRPFALSAACYGAGLLLIVHLGLYPPLATVVGGNLLLAVSAVCLHRGFSVLAGRRPPWPAYILFLLLYVGGEAWYQFGRDDINARIVLASLIRVPLFLHAGWLALAVLRRGGGGRPLALMCAVPLGWALLLLVRAAVVVEQGPLEAFVSSGGFPAFYYLPAGLAYVALAAGLLLHDAEQLTTLLGGRTRSNAEALEARIVRQLEVQADLRSILDNLPDIFYRTDHTGRLLMVSRSAEEQLGYTVEELLGSDAGLIHGDPGSRRRMLAAMEAGGGAVADYELRLRHKDGRLLWAATSSRFYHNAEGRPAGTEGVVRLIEERKRVEAYIRESQSLIQAMLDASSDAIMLFKPDGTMLAVNEVLAKRLGRSAADLTGLCLWDLFPSEISKARREEVERVVETGEAIHYLDRRGALYLDNSIYPVRGADGAIDKVAVYSRDITAQTLAEARVASYLADLERSNAELEQFAYVASHDLREPLRMISSYLSLLERRCAPQLDADGREFLGFARDGAKRMDHLVLDLLDFSRIDRKGSPLGVMEAEPALRQALHHLAPAIEESGARVEVVGGEGEPRVLGDADQITRLFQNLIGNAVKYRADDRPPHIRVSWSRRGAMWEFRVADNGIGIEAEYFDRIFRIFQRLHTQDRYEGTGIGLAICKKIVERHGGHIVVSSVPGEGTTFTFTLTAG